MCFLCTVKNIKLNSQSFEQKDKEDGVWGGGRKTSPQRRKRRRRGIYSPREAAKGTRLKETETDCSHLLLSPHFCATQFIWIRNPLFTPNSRILKKKNKTLKGTHPTHCFTSQPMYSKCYRHTGMHSPSPSLHCSILSVFKGRSAHTFEGEGLHVCEGRAASSMTDVHTEAGGDVTTCPFNMSNSQQTLNHCN